jgi:hypothetical protein
MQAGKGTFGQLLTNPELYNKFNATADDFQKVTAKLEQQRQLSWASS